MLWVLEESGIREHGDFRLLIALAERAHDDGRSAYPSIAWLAKRLGRSDRQVRRGLDRLKDNGWIVPGDQELVSHFRADRRPVVYDLVMSKRGDTSVTPLPLRGDTSGIHGVTPDVLQDVPSLLRNEYVRSESGDSALPIDVVPKKPAPKNRVQLPESWAPGVKHFSLGADLRISPERVRSEAEQFKDHHLSRGSKFIDWDAAFRKWLRNSKEFADRANAGGPARSERRRDPKSGMLVER